MTPLPVSVVAGTLVAAVVFAFVADAAKRRFTGDWGSHDLRTKRIGLK